MGEVYRARDPKLNRDVAIKVLPASVAGDPDRLARFKREAQVLASLNHPNIGHIYGFEDSGATHGLARLIDAADPTPGPTPDVYAFSRETVQRKLYRIPLAAR